MFRGLHAIRLDNKGRLAIPSRFTDRESSTGPSTFVATIDTEVTCLLLYPLAEWEQIEQKLVELPSFNPASRRIQRLLLGHATEIEMDGSNRILLPPLLREYAKLDKTVMLVGQGKKFEIWADALWEAHRSDWLSAHNETELPQDMQSISL